MGDLVPADLCIESGQVLVDQSTLTGESVPVEAGSGQMAYAGTQVKRGEATGEITATGTRTKFGKTAELVRQAKTGSHLERIIFKIVTALVILDTTLVVAVLIYALAAAIPLGEILPFALILLVASVPVALPATFTVATALGALELAKQGVLVTRLSAIEEAAGMDVLCSDKTGTITKNELEVAALHCYAPYTEKELLRLAVSACDESTQDPIDLAILITARRRGVPASVPSEFASFPLILRPSDRRVSCKVRARRSAWSRARRRLCRRCVRLRMILLARMSNGWRPKAAAFLPWPPDPKMIYAWQG